MAVVVAIIVIIMIISPFRWLGRGVAMLRYPIILGWIAGAPLAARSGIHGVPLIARGRIHGAPRADRPQVSGSLVGVLVSRHRVDRSAIRIT